MTQDDITQKIVTTVTLLDGSDSMSIITTDNSTSYTVAGLMFGQSNTLL